MGLPTCKIISATLAEAITNMYAVRIQQLFFPRQVQAVRRVTILYVFEHTCSQRHLATNNVYHS